MLIVLCASADAGPLSKLRERFSSRKHEPTQVQGQDQSCPNCKVKERSLLRRQPSAAGTQSPSGPAAPLQAPKAPAEKTAPKAATSNGASLSSDESRMVASINNWRTARNLEPLAADPLLVRIARARVGVFNHNHPRFGWSWQQAHREGFNGPVTDNLTQGQTSPEEVADGWGSSPGHAKQMEGFTKLNGQWIDQRFNLCGVAHQGQNYIAVFGRREDAAKECNCQQTGVCTCGSNCNCK